MPTEPENNVEAAPTWCRLAGGCALVVGALLLTGCASVATSDDRDIAASAWAKASVLDASDRSWERVRFPGKDPARFQPQDMGGRVALGAVAHSAASAVRQKVRVEPAELGRLKFSWNVPELIAGADLALRDADDSPVRIVLAFEGDRSRLSQRDAVLSDLMRSLTGEEMPYATLMYVWCNRRAPGTVVLNPRTDRIRKLVVESGPRRLDRWLDYERDIRADFERAFGEPPGALVGVAIMTDSDNTRTSTRAWYGPVRLTSRGR